MSRSPIVASINASIAASLCISLGMNLFLVPSRLLDGGLIGVGLLFQYYFGWMPGRTIFVISIPIFVFVFFFNRTLFVNSVYGLVISTVLIDLLAPMQDLFALPVVLDAMYGGAFIGTGIGLLLAYGMNTGGTDLVAQIVSAKLSVPPAAIILTIDTVIVLFGLDIIGIERTAYSLITILFGAAFTHLFSKQKLFG